MASQLVRSRTTPTAADNTMRAQDAVYGQELILALNEDDPLADLGLCETFSILNIHHAKVEMAIRRWDHEENGVLSPALQAKLDELKRYGPLVSTTGFEVPFREATTIRDISDHRSADHYLYLYLISLWTHVRFVSSFA